MELKPGSDIFVPLARKWIRLILHLPGSEWSKQQVAQLWQRDRAMHAPVPVFEWGWVTLSKFQTEGGVAHQPLLVSEN